MTEESTERDPELGSALAGVCGTAPEAEVDWERLRARIARKAAASPHSESRRGPLAGAALPARRAPGWRLGALAGAAVAASLALLFLTDRPQSEGRGGAQPVVTAGLSTIEEILGADVSEAELRALLAGAGDVEALLLLAASESESEL